MLKERREQFLSLRRSCGPLLLSLVTQRVEQLYPNSWRDEILDGRDQTRELWELTSSMGRSQQNLTTSSGAQPQQERSSSSSLSLTAKLFSPPRATQQNAHEHFAYLKIHIKEVASLFVQEVRVAAWNRLWVDTRSAPAPDHGVAPLLSGVALHEAVSSEGVSDFQRIATKVSSPTEFMNSAQKRNSAISEALVHQQGLPGVNLVLEARGVGETKSAELFVGDSSPPASESRIPPPAPKSLAFEIATDGVHARSFLYPVADRGFLGTRDGAAGYSSPHGTHAGSFLIKADRASGLGLLNVSSTGGDGAIGQFGGHGLSGARGQPGEDAGFLVGTTSNFVLVRGGDATPAGDAGFPGVSGQDGRRGLGGDVLVSIGGVGSFSTGGVEQEHDAGMPETPSVWIADQKRKRHDHGKNVWGDHEEDHDSWGPAGIAPSLDDVDGSSDASSKPHNTARGAFLQQVLPRGGDAQAAAPDGRDLVMISSLVARPADDASPDMDEEDRVPTKKTDSRTGYWTGWARKEVLDYFGRGGARAKLPAVRLNETKEIALKEQIEVPSSAGPFRGAEESVTCEFVWRVFLKGPPTKEEKPFEKPELLRVSCPDAATFNRLLSHRWDRWFFEDHSLKDGPPLNPRSSDAPVLRRSHHVRFNNHKRGLSRASEAPQFRPAHNDKKQREFQSSKDALVNDTVALQMLDLELSEARDKHLSLTSKVLGVDGSMEQIVSRQLAAETLRSSREAAEAESETLTQQSQLNREMEESNLESMADLHNGKMDTVATMRFFLNQLTPYNQHGQQLAHAYHLQVVSTQSINDMREKREEKQKKITTITECQVVWMTQTEEKVGCSANKNAANTCRKKRQQGERVWWRDTKDIERELKQNRGQVEQLLKQKQLERYRSTFFPRSCRSCPGENWTDEQYLFLSLSVSVPVPHPQETFEENTKV